MYVVVWEPRRGSGGGHQAVNDRQRAEQISRVMCRAMPDAEIRVMSAEAYGAAAVVERQQREPYRSTRSR
jgi:acetyl-CoA carboxylase carboxyltransferase component